jgi:type IV secretory system conjugative DNA transfer VirD4/TraG family protein
VKREVQGILNIGINAASQTQLSPDYNSLFSIIGEDLANNKDVVIHQKDRTQGLYVIGTTGTGKSTLLAQLILTDINQGLGVCLIEPHGDLTNIVLAGIPDQRLKDVVYLDMTDSEYPFGLNLFQCPKPRTSEAMAKTASFVHHVFERLWGVGTDTPRLMQVLRAVTRTLMENPGTTFAEIPLLFGSDAARAKMVGNVTNSSIVSFWEDFNLKSPRGRDDFTDSTKNKVMSFLDEPIVRTIVSQSETTIDFRKIMDSGKILLIKLSPQFKEVSLLIGSIIIGKLLMAAWSRSDTDEDKRRQFNLYCDEYQRFATSDLRSFIDEARKFRVAITLSHQTLSQLDEDNRDAAMGAANMVVFRVTGDDGDALAKNFDTTPTQVVVGDDPVRAPVSDVVSHLVRLGHNNPRVTQFAQRYLQRLEDFVDKKYEQYPPHAGLYDATYLRGADIRKGRALLNECLYRCMTTESASFQVPTLAIYILAVSQLDGTEWGLEPFVKKDWWPFGPKFLQGFKGQADRFGSPEFIEDDCIEGYIALFRKKEQGGPMAVAEMIKWLRYSMKVLSEYPIEVNTGQYKPKLQVRQHSDMENEIANKLRQQKKRQARVRLQSGEHNIRTKDFYGTFPGRGLASRISQIRVLMRAQGYCKHRVDVEKEIRARQEKLRNGGGGTQKPAGPPPIHF